MTFDKEGAQDKHVERYPQVTGTLSSYDKSVSVEYKVFKLYCTLSRIIAPISMVGER